MQDIKNFSPQELEDILKASGYPAFRAGQIYNWIYKRGVLDFDRMANLPTQLRLDLGKKFFLRSLKLVQSQVSKDGTQKLLFALNDTNLIEAVNIPAKGRVTGCISAQAGCKFRCFFCASGLSGFKRNLGAAEIVEEALYLKQNSEGNKLTHIVFMGVGEPLDNYDNVIKAIRIINSKQGMNIGARKITISTCGIIPGIRRLSDEGMQVELSISLHAPDENLRSRIMPVNKIYPLKELLSACRGYIQKTKRQITFEYILMKGINSDLQGAERLSKILKGLKLCKVNLIPANKFKGCNIYPAPQKDTAVKLWCGVYPPEKAQALLFRDTLQKAGINVTLRTARGEDIEAACGQLRLRYEK